jgi:hypothetical protein
MEPSEIDVRMALIQTLMDCEPTEELKLIAYLKFTMHEMQESHSKQIQYLSGDHGPCI